MKTYAKTHVGRQRDHNEDAVLCETVDPIGGYLLAVADGMGGHRAGDVASQTATRTLKEVVVDALAAGRTDLRTILAEAFEKTDREIRMLNDDHEDPGMGTTLVAAIIRDGTALVGNVGDSRAYLLGDGIKQITEDHSLVRELVDEGRITEAEAKTHPQRNVVTQAIGTHDEIAPDFFEVDLDADVLLLCSDGLTEEVGDETIRAVVTGKSDPTAVADRLIEQANENGGSDNISVVVAREP